MAHIRWLLQSLRHRVSVNHRQPFVMLGHFPSEMLASAVNIFTMADFYYPDGLLGILN